MNRDWGSGQVELGQAFGNKFRFGYIFIFLVQLIRRIYICVKCFFNTNQRLGAKVGRGGEGGTNINSYPFLICLQR